MTIPEVLSSIRLHEDNAKKAKTAYQKYVVIRDLQKDAIALTKLTSECIAAFADDAFMEP